MKQKTNIAVNKSKVIVTTSNNDVYEFEIKQLLRYAMIVKDNSRKGKIFKKIAMFMFENDLDIGKSGK